MPPSRFIAILCFIACLDSSVAGNKVDFSLQIRPILSANCYHCHGQDEHSRKAKLRLDVRTEAVAVRDKQVIPIKPGEAAGSAVMTRIQSQDAEEIMPPPKHGPPLKPAEIELLRQWISEGAEYADHWAFTKPQRPAVPASATPWGHQPWDAFILEKLTAHGLQPSAEADRNTLARRVALDLTGLPPEPALLEAFLADTATDAYEKYVDALLAAPAYGERWARMWMDLARYADSAGYGSDPLRLNIWPFRDWVINAFNHNLPYDQFSRMQLAGDLLPGLKDEDRVATAFHRNTMTNTEGGTDDEEWRVAAVKDRTHVTMQVWMGLTMGCAQCHSHKFDPISQKEFYSAFAIFNQTADRDLGDEAPTLPIPNPAEQARQQQMQNELAALEAQYNGSTPELDAEFATWEEKVRTEVPWQVLEVGNFEVPAGSALWERQTDASVVVRSGMAAKSDYVVKCTTPLRGITALRLEALPDDSLPSCGPGHAANGNAVLSEIQVTATPSKPTVTKARFVRVEAPGKGRFLHLAEVEVMSGGVNVARSGKASQISTDYGGEASRAIDGNRDGNYPANSTSHTAATDNPWWEVDLGQELPVDEIIISNRTDGGSASRLPPWKVTVLDPQHQVVWNKDFTETPQTGFVIKVSDQRRSLALGNATATFSQMNWEVTRALDGDLKTGWAFSPQTGARQAAVFEIAQPVDFGEDNPIVLEFSLQQQYGEEHTLGRFRLSATNLPPPVLALSPTVRDVLAKARTDRSAAELQMLRELFRPSSKILTALAATIEQKKKALAEIPPVRVPVMQELAANQQRETHLLIKGNFLDPGEPVTPTVPAAFGAWPEGAPLNRLGLVDWIFSADNPLTARVAVNRFWAQLFGTGLVQTEEDFGTQGTLPSHSELLDWLAVDFREKGWDIKALLKMLVTSATYRQSSAVSPTIQEKDAAGRLLSHYPRRRLDADQVRDQALAVSGLLSHKLGGPSVYPPQPDGLWKAAFNGERTYATSQGEDRYRRGLYTIWRRSVPYPSMATFDAPSRETCTVRRVPTNTPLQALVTLNDPVYFEAAQSFARRILTQGGADVVSKLHFACRMALARDAKPEELTALQKLLDAEIATYKADPAKAQALATDPLGPLPAGLEPATTAAWTVLSNVILNLDGFLMKS